MEQNRFIQRKKNILRKDALRVSEVVAWRCSVGNEKNLKIYWKTVQLTALIFSCEFCEICKNTYSVEHHRTAASGIFLLKHNDPKK